MTRGNGIFFACVVGLPTSGMASAAAHKLVDQTAKTKS
jgi:hypothetical protein